MFRGKFPAAIFLIFNYNGIAVIAQDCLIASMGKPRFFLTM
jgi:hypothetical protein